MKSFIKILGSLILLTNLHCQNIGDILNNYADAIGGIEKWEKLESTSLYGKATMQGMEINLIVHQKKPHFFYQEFNLLGNKIIQALEGEKGWYINPFEGRTEPQDLGPEQVRNLEENNMLDDKLLFYKKQGGNVELVGKSDVNGTPCYVIHLYDKNGNKTTYFLDQDLYIPLKTTYEFKGDNDVTNVSEQLFLDYQFVEGLLLPHKINQKVNGESILEVQFQKIEVNKLIGEDIFKKPQKK